MIELEGLEAWKTKAGYTPENTFSLSEYQTFSKSLLRKLSESELRFDCADMALYTLMKYYEYKQVPFEINYNGNIISSNDKDFNNFEDFFYGDETGYKETIKKTGNTGSRNVVKNGIKGVVGARHLHNGEYSLATEIKENEASSGDIITNGLHTQMIVSSGLYYWEDNDQITTRTTIAQGNPNDELGGQIPEIYDTPIWAKTSRWTVFTNESVAGRNEATGVIPDFGVEANIK